ncbi:unnamed protein product [Brassicogethes aeneus]|uniref:Uncharacterized protein n=1 Tax=Brassicogethes aeneus TaxID=1431903 RepID=A0A9P0BBI6_BRAAE|nr:unnamed protein product [Brassicogethes aeneus]
MDVPLRVITTPNLSASSIPDRNMQSSAKHIDGCVGNRIPIIAIFCVTAVIGFPSPKEIVLPEFNVSSAAEINDLTANGVQGRSINGVASQNSFDDTIKEVEAILRTNPALPRLTRGEILDLLDNITQTDIEKAKVLTNNRGQKAIMVVMPYTPESENNLQDFYTKPPITKMIGNEGDKNVKGGTNSVKRPSGRVSTSTSSRTISTSTITTTDTPVTNRRIPPKKQYTPKKRTKVETTYPTSTPKYTEYYSRYSTIHPRTTTIQSTTTSTYKPRSRGTPLRRRRPTTTKFPNHSYDEDMLVQENVHEEVYQAPKEQVFFNTNSQQFLPEEAVTKKETSLRKEHPTTSSPDLIELNIPTHLTEVVKDMHLSDAMDGTILVPTQRPIPQTDVKDDAQKIKDLMESLGIQTPTTTDMPNMENVASNLSPDMKDLLMSFGLIPNPDKAKDVKVEDPAPDKAEINPDSFVGFKPLPEDSSSRSEMDELLATFGLGRSSRKIKSHDYKQDNDHISLEAVPDEYKGLLTELGLRQGRKIESYSMKKTLAKDSKDTTTEKQHVFNPSDSQYASEEELDKLGRLINMVKELESLNRTITDEDLKKIDLQTLKELAESIKEEEDSIVPLNEQNPAPNPINFDYGLSKNEVKRQESTTTTEEPKNPSIKDLEESFGGQTSTTTTTEAPVEETPAPKRTGAYFLVDWNSFLDIDDQKGKRVNLRFQPTVGDPKSDNVTKWESIYDDYKSTSVGVFKNKLLVVEFLKNQEKIVTQEFLNEMDYNIESIKIFRHFTTKKSVILLLASSNTSINWYEVNNLKLEKIWTWNMVNQIKHFNVIKVKNHHTIVVLNNISKIEVYDFTKDLESFWLSQSISLQSSSSISTFVQHKWNYFLSITQKNHILVYKYERDHFVHHKNISCENVDQIVSFGIGFQSFLAVNGLTPKIYKFEDNELMEQNVTNSHLNHIQFFKVLPITKYRDDTALLIQRNLIHESHNSTVIDLLTFNGENFVEHEDIPCLYFGEDKNNLNCLINDETKNSISQITPLSIDDDTYLLIPNENGHNVLFSINVSLEVSENPAMEELEDLRREKEEIMNLLNTYEGIRKNKTSSELVSSSFINEANIDDKSKEFKDLFKDKNAFNEESKFRRIQDDIKNIGDEITDLNNIMDEILKKESRNSFDTILIEENSVIENGIFEDISAENIDVSHIVLKNNLRHIHGRKTMNNLIVNNTSTEFLNGIPYNDILHKSDTKIEINGNIQFKHEVRAADIHIQGGVVNNVNIEKDVVFINKNLTDTIHFKNILVENSFFAEEVNNLNIVDNKVKNHVNEDTIFLPENATVKNINGENLNDFINEICLRNIKCYIPNNFIIQGNLLVRSNSYTENLNDLPYPDGYVFIDESPHLNITGKKVFENLGVMEIRTPGVLNNENTDEFITLLSDQHIHNIEFNELEVAEEINIKGSIVGKHLEKFLSNPTLSNTVPSINANTNFKKVILDGDLIITNNLNQENFKKTLQDIVYKDEPTSEIIGRVDFNEGISIQNNLEIQSNIINNINIHDIITKDTDQVLNIKTLDGSVGFEHIYVEGLFGGQNVSKLDFETIKLSGEQFISSTLIFEDVEIKNLEITKKLNDLPPNDYYYVNSDNIFDNMVTIDNCKVDTINILKDIKGDIVDFDLENILENTLSFRKDQTISGDFTAKILNVDRLNASRVNGGDYGKLFEQENIYKEMLNKVIRRNMEIENLHINDSLNVNNINGRKTSYMLGNSRNLPRNIEFENDVFFNKIQINKLSEVNFTEFITDIIFKSDENPQITGDITFKNIVEVAKLIETEKINNIDIDDILTKFGKQQINKAVVIQGDVHFDDVHITQGVNGVDVRDVFEKIEMKEDTLNIKDNVVFERQPQILNLTIQGLVNEVELEKHVKNIVNVNKPNEINGKIVFTKHVNITGDILIDNVLNKRKVAEILSNALYIDRDANIQGPIVFNETTFFLKSLLIDRDLTTKKLFGFDLENWKQNAIFINKGLIKGTYVFENAIIHESILSKYINDIDMNTIVPLRTEQTIPAMFFDYISVIRALNLKGSMSGYNLSEEVQNALTMDKSYDINSEIVFQNNVLIRNTMNTPKINNINVQKIVTTNTDQNLTALYHFQMKCTLHNNIFIDGYLNNINLTEWNQNVVKENSENIQDIMQTWDVSGNITVMEDLNGGGMINNMDLHKIQSELEEKINYKYSVEKAIIDDYNNLCKDIENVYDLSKKQIYKFRYFDKFQDLVFENPIAYVKHIKYNHNNFLLVNEEDSCTTHILFYGNNFKPVYSVETGFVDEIITVLDRNTMYLVTRSPRKTRCDVVGTNVWKFGKGNMEQLVNLDNINLLQESMVPGTFYGMNKHGVTEFIIKKNIVKPYRKWEIFENNMAFVPRGLGTGFAVRTGKKLIRLNRDQPDDLENTNELSMNLDVIIVGNVTEESNHYFPGRLGGDLVATKVGTKESERTLLAVAAHEEISVRDPLDFITVYSDPVHGKMFHKIPTYKPSSLLSIEFGNGETLLAFLENKRILQIYEYKGINGFKHRLSAKISASKLFLMDLPLTQYLNERKFIGAIQDNKITLLEAVMSEVETTLAASDVFNVANESTNRGDDGQAYDKEDKSLQLTNNSPTSNSNPKCLD